MVSNADVVRTLERIAGRLEILGASAHEARPDRFATPQVGELVVGLYRVDDGAPLAGESEDDVHAAPGPAWMPPHRRVDPAEMDSDVLVRIATEA